MHFFCHHGPAHSQWCELQLCLTEAERFLGSSHGFVFSRSMCSIFSFFFFPGTGMPIPNNFFYEYLKSYILLCIAHLSLLLPRSVSARVLSEQVQVFFAEYVPRRGERNIGFWCILCQRPQLECKKRVQGGEMCGLFCMKKISQ